MPRGGLHLVARRVDFLFRAPTSTIEWFPPNRVAAIVALFKGGRMTARIDDGPGSLTPGTAADAIGGSGTGLETQLMPLPDDVLVFHPAPGEWCANEVVGHMIEAERRGFAGRIREMLAADEPTFVPWDQKGVARARADCERHPRELIGEFAALRAESVQLVGGLHSADLERSGNHPAVGRLCVSDIVHEWIHHDANHVRQILANIQGAVWPHMGNAQRFSQSE